MDNDNLPTLGPGVDLSKITPLNHRRSVSLMNHFLMHTANFLNKFATASEEKLARQSLEMQKIEIALNILEAKLSSIPGLDDITAVQPTVAAAPEVNTESSGTSNAAVTVQEKPADNVADSDVVLVKDDARYMKYLKMLNVGVPKGAVSGKMIMEGLDPDLLDTPDAPVPDGAKVEEESDNESQSLSSDDNFSD